jgi:hypothetical protein
MYPALKNVFSIIAVLLAITANAQTKQSSQDGQAKPTVTFAVPKVGSTLAQFQQDYPAAKCFTEFCVVDKESLAGIFIAPNIPILREIVAINDGKISSVSAHLGSNGTAAKDALTGLLGKPGDYREDCIQDAKETADRVTNFESDIHDILWDNVFEAKAELCKFKVPAGFSEPSWFNDDVKIQMKNVYGSDAEVVFTPDSSQKKIEELQKQIEDIKAKAPKQ